MKRLLVIFPICLLLAGCGFESEKPINDIVVPEVIKIEETVEESIAEESIAEEPVVEEPVVEEPSVEVSAEPSIEAILTPKAPNGYVVCIDPGHQSKQNSEKEPDGPGSSTMKAKVSSGTKGVSSGMAEYEFTLELSLKLKDELTARGYNVYMTRETNDVDISNSERAAYANDLNADCFIRVHANGSENSSVRGAETLCQTASNPYNSALYTKSRSLSDNVLTGLCDKTGLKKRNVVETDTMSGINWCNVPVTIVEVGFMSNSEDDLYITSEDGQKNIALGIANGVDSYFAGEN